MPRPLIRAAALVALFLLLPAGLAPPAAEAAIAVFDGANLSQNILTAVRTARAILQRIEMIKNQIRQIEWMIDNVRDLEDPTVASLRSLLAGLERLLLGYRQAALYTLADLERRIETVYPDPEEATTELGSAELARAETTLETARAVLIATREIGRDLSSQQARIGSMEGQVLATDGLLAAAQAQGLLSGAAAQQLVLVNQQLALANNLHSVRTAHEISSEAQAVASFEAAVKASRIGAGPYASFPPLPVIPARYPRILRP